MQTRAVAVSQQSPTEIARIGDDPILPGHIGGQLFTVIQHDGFRHRFQQLGFVLEMPIERGRLHAEMLRQATGAQSIDADFIQQRQRSAQDGFTR